MRELNPNRLLVARIAGYGMECADLGTWLFLLGHHIRGTYPEIDLCVYQRRDARIAMMRNNCVKEALEKGCGKMLMIDPDARMDPYVETDGHGGYKTRFRPFFDEALGFMRGRQADGAHYVLAAPACGPPPDTAVQVFRRCPDGSNQKIPRKEAESMTGWHRVGAVGTHAMLIDMHVFDHMDHPYFDDTFTDNSHTQLHFGQDVYFCRKCVEQNIPVLVNFDCWSDHWQHVPIKRPGVTEAESSLYEDCSGQRQSPKETKPTYKCWE